MAETEGSDENDFLDKSLSVWKGKGIIEKENFQPLPLDLCTAASLGKDECVKVHITRGEIDLDKRNIGGWTALMYACFIGHIKIVRLLLEAGVSANIRNKKCESPLMLAASCGNENVGLLLFRHDLDLEARDKRGWTALFHATYSGHQNMVRFLLDHGADINVVEPSMGMTPFMEAATEGHEIILQLFLQYGVNVNCKSYNGDTARSLALLNGNMKIVSLIDNHVIPIHVVSLRSEAGLEMDLSSSDDAGHRNKSGPPKPSHGKPRAGPTGGPSIMDGPEAIARLIDRTRSTEPGGKPEPAIPTGYVSFPDDPGTSPLQDEEKKLSYRDVTSPINPEDYLLDSSAGKEPCEVDDDTNAFSKTGALTIKSSSGSSGGLAAALGIRREDSLDSDEFPHDSSCGDSHAHRNSGDTSSTSSEGVDDRNIILEQVTTALINNSDINKDVPQSPEIVREADKGNRKKTRDNLTQAKVNEIGVLKTSVSEWVNSVHDNPTPVPENYLGTPLAASPATNTEAKSVSAQPPAFDNHLPGKDSQYSSNQNQIPSNNEQFRFAPSDNVALIEQKKTMTIHTPSVIAKSEFITNSSHLNQSPSTENLPAGLGHNPAPVTGPISGSKYKHGPQKQMEFKRLVHGPTHTEGYSLQPVTDGLPVTSPLVGTVTNKFPTPSPVSALSLLNTGNVPAAHVPQNIQIPIEEGNVPLSLPSAVMLNQSNIENFPNPGANTNNPGPTTGSYGNPGSHGNHQNPGITNPSPVSRDSAGNYGNLGNHGNHQTLGITNPTPVSRDTTSNLGSHGNNQNTGTTTPTASRDTAGNYGNPGSHGNHHNSPIQPPPGFQVQYNTYQMFPQTSPGASPGVAGTPPKAAPLVPMATPGLEGQKETRFSQATSFLDRMSGQHVPDLTTLLDQLNLGKYLPTFEEQDVDLQVFLSLTDNELKECGIKLFGPRKKMTNAIARWHGSARPALSEVEQAYADRLEGEVQEMGLQLQTVGEQLEKLKAQVKQEQQLRGVTETCLMEERVAWQYVQRVVIDTRKQCDDFNEVVRKLKQYTEEIKSRVPPDPTSGQMRPIRGAGGQPGTSEWLPTDAVLRKVDYYIQEVQHLLGGVTVNTDRLLGRNMQSQSPDRTYT